MAGLQPVGNLPNGVTWSSSTYGEPKRKGNPYDPRTIIGEAEVELGDVDSYIAWRKSVGLKTLDPYTARSRMKTDKSYRKYLVAERKNQKEARKRQEKLEDEARKNARADAREAKKNAKSDANALKKRAIEITERWDKYEGNPPDGYGETMKPEAAMREAYNRALGERKLMEEITGKTAMNTRSVSPSVAEAQSTGENNRPAGGTIVKSKSGKEALRVPIGEMNGKQVYELYSKGSDGWVKQGMQSPNGFIPEDKMGTNKLRMDTFKTALNKYNRDIGYTGEDGLGSDAVKARMKKDWGKNWEKVYLDEQGGVKQLYKDGKGGLRDTRNAPEVIPEAEVDLINDLRGNERKGDYALGDLDQARGQEPSGGLYPPDGEFGMSQKRLTPEAVPVVEPQPAEAPGVDDLMPEAYMRGDRPPAFSGQAVIDTITAPFRAYHDYAKAKGEGRDHPYDTQNEVGWGVTDSANEWRTPEEGKRQYTGMQPSEDPRDYYTPAPSGRLDPSYLDTDMLTTAEEEAMVEQMLKDDPEFYGVEETTDYDGWY